MSSLSPLALAYTTADTDIAHRIEQTLGSYALFSHFRVNDANQGPVLSELMQGFRGRILLLVSHDFLHNPNAMLHASRVLGNGRETKAILIDRLVEDAQLGETVELRTTLDRQSDLMHHVNYWQQRYLDLRRQKRELSEEIGSEFDDYLAKIREVSGQVNDFCTI